VTITVTVYYGNLVNKHTNTRDHKQYLTGCRQGE